jgi:hypothetical protein
MNRLRQTHARGGHWAVLVVGTVGVDSHSVASGSVLAIPHGSGRAPGGAPVAPLVPAGVVGVHGAAAAAPAAARATACVGAAGTAACPAARFPPELPLRLSTASCVVTCAVWVAGATPPPT